MQTPGDGLRIDMVHLGGHVLLTIVGEVDLATAGSFRAAIDQGIQQAGKVVVDFSGVTFMDSSGLNVLVAVTAPGRATDSVLIRNAPRSIHRLLSITGLDDVIRIEGEPIDARQAS